MHSLDDILSAYRNQIALPWENDIPPESRVWILWYEKHLQRKFTKYLVDFESATFRANHGWKCCSISNWIGSWIANHEFFNALVEQPKELRGLKTDIVNDLSEFLIKKLESCSDNDMLAIDGCGALYGVVKVSDLIGNIQASIPGRILIGFPGKHQNGIYRLLDAQDGWNYHAIPIPQGSSL